MLKKVLTGSALFISAVSTVYAGAFYMGPMIVHQSITAGDAGYEGLSAQVAAGYGTFAKDPLYFAAEIFASPKSITIHDNSVPEGSLKAGSSYGISIIPGYRFDDLIMAYVRLGLIYTNFTSFDTTRRGYQGGGGIEVALTSNWSARGEYVYTSYSNLDDMGTPKNGQFGLGAIYRFC